MGSRRFEAVGWPPLMVPVHGVRGFSASGITIMSAGSEQSKYSKPCWCSRECWGGSSVRVCARVLYIYDKTVLVPVNDGNMVPSSGYFGCREDRWRIWVSTLP